MPRRRGQAGLEGQGCLRTVGTRAKGSRREREVSHRVRAASATRSTAPNSAPAGGAPPRASSSETSADSLRSLLSPSSPLASYPNTTRVLPAQAAPCRPCTQTRPWHRQEALRSLCKAQAAGLTLGGTMAWGREVTGGGAADHRTSPLKESWPSSSRVFSVSLHGPRSGGKLGISEAQRHPAGRGAAFPSHAGLRAKPAALPEGEPHRPGPAAGHTHLPPPLSSGQTQGFVICGPPVPGAAVNGPPHNALVH